MGNSICCTKNEDDLSLGHNFNGRLKQRNDLSKILKLQLQILNEDSAQQKSQVTLKNTPILIFSHHNQQESRKHSQKQNEAIIKGKIMNDKLKSIKTHRHNTVFMPNALAVAGVGGIFMNNAVNYCDSTSDVILALDSSRQNNQSNTLLDTSMTELHHMLHIGNNNLNLNDRQANHQSHHSNKRHLTMKAHHDYNSADESYDSFRSEQNDQYQETGNGNANTQGNKLNQKRFDQLQSGQSSSKRSSNGNLSFCTAQDEKSEIDSQEENGMNFNQNQAEESKENSGPGFDDTLDIPKNLINDNEINYDFTKRFLVDFINDIEADQVGWQNKLNTDLTKVWSKTGSKYDKSNPFIKCEWIFHETQEPKDVFDCYMLMEQRLKWDEGLAQYEEFQSINEYLQVVYVVSKAPMNFKNRDFIEKRIYFKHDGCHYIYITAVPDSIKPATKVNERAKSVVGCFKIEKSSDGKGVRMLACLQTDLKIGFGLSMVAALLPKAMNEWGDKIRKFLLSNQQ
eukprot:403374833